MIDIFGKKEIFTREVNVRRYRSPRLMLRATGREQYVDLGDLEVVRSGDTDNVELVFFRLNVFFTEEALMGEFELRGLKAADPYSVAAANEVEPDLAKDCPNGSHWKDRHGRWCFIEFGEHSCIRYVRVSRNSFGWHAGKWAVGVWDDQTKSKGGES